MNILGIETSCDECSVAVVEKGRRILSNVVSSQIEHHAPWNGVVPEIASRLHVEWIDEVTGAALKEAGLGMSRIDAVAVTVQPGLIGSLLVGLSYAKGLAWFAGKPWVGVNHLLAHLYAPQMEYEIPYPHLGLIVSGGHTMLSLVHGETQMDVLGTTIDDACGEAFDKVAKFYEMGYPGGVFLDQLAEKGDPDAFRFPEPRLHKGNHTYDVSYSGLKTAAVNQLEQFRNGSEKKATIENIAASFRRAAIDMLIRKLRRAADDTGMRRVVVGGGVSANRYLRKTLKNDKTLEVFFPSMNLCTDNGAMIAGLGYHQIVRGEYSEYSLGASPRMEGSRRLYL